MILDEEERADNHEAAADRWEHWEHVARDLADDLAVDAPERDRAGKPPVDEMARLHESGLLTAFAPATPTGRGLGWPSAFSIVRRIAAADSSIAELLGRHYVLSWCGRLMLPTDRGLSRDAHALPQGRLLAGEIGPGAIADRAADDALTVTVDDRGYSLNGRSGMVPGALVADRILLSARRAGAAESRLVMLIDPSDTGITIDPVDHLLGQRLTGAGMLTFDHLHVSADQVLDSITADEHLTPPITTLVPLALRMMTAHVVLGIAEGALAEARDATLITSHARASSRRRHDPDPLATSPDPDLLQAYGELAAAAHVAATVVEHATHALAEGVRQGKELDAEQCSRIAMSVTTAEATAGESALRITARVLELVDAADMDRFWRNTRTLTTRRSPAPRLRAIGEHFLYAARP
ncbi:acyl-CoA dehydrogenase [Streptomyces sp. CA-250714]|uniref:acyl-CoA dehydrogenase n=1 Tax=Streptomyces sp. CA-250714 TaxID=3240060 RepID=UPI003D91814D